MTYPPPPPPGNDGSGYPPPDPYDPAGQQYQLGGSPQPDPYAPPAYDPNAPQSGMPYDPNAAYGTQPASGIPVTGQPYGGPAMPMPPAKSGPPAWAFIVGGVVLVLVLGIVGAVILINKNTGGNSADDDKSSSASSSSSSSGSSSSAPSGDVITDPNTGLSFTRISTWTDAPDLKASTPDFLASQGQYLTTDTHWQAMFAVGEVDTSAVGYKSADDMKSAVKKISKAVDKTDYNKDSSGNDPLDGLKRDGKAKYKKLTIGGKDALAAIYTLKWDKSNGLAADSEKLAVGVVDVGGGKLAGFVVSNPSNTPDAEVKNTSDALDSLTVT